MAVPEQVRVDRWLSAARIYKSRTVAAAACEARHVRINGVVAKPSAVVRVADEVVARAPRGPTVLQVLALEQKRQSPARARELYEDHSPPAPPRDDYFWMRPQRKGRPTKAERRATERLKGR